MNTGILICLHESHSSRCVNACVHLRTLMGDHKQDVSEQRSRNVGFACVLETVPLSAGGVYWSEESSALKWVLALPGPHAGEAWAKGAGFSIPEAPWAGVGLWIHRHVLPRVCSNVFVCLHRSWKKRLSHSCWTRKEMAWLFPSFVVINYLKSLLEVIRPGDVDTDRRVMEIENTPNLWVVNLAWLMGVTGIASRYWGGNLGINSMETLLPHCVSSGEHFPS